MDNNAKYSLKRCTHLTNQKLWIFSKFALRNYIELLGSNPFFCLFFSAASEEYLSTSPTSNCTWSHGGKSRLKNTDCIKNKRLCTCWNSIMVNLMSEESHVRQIESSIEEILIVGGPGHRG